MMEPLGSFLVPEDVSITAVERLPPAVRNAAGAAPGDFAIMRPRGRAHSKIVDGTTAALLESFRVPRSIADGIIAFSRQRSLDPESTLIDAFPVLRDLVRDQFLVPLGAPAARPIVPSLVPGDRVLAFEILSCIQVMEDTELYQVAHPAGQVGALKIAADPESGRAGAMVAHEARVLRRLNGCVCPPLLAAGRHRGRAFLVTAWCSGTPPAVVAEELRSTRRGPDRPALLHLARAVVDAYAVLHARDVVHGDVHRQNLLVDAAGRVIILDFGLARLPQGRTGVPRGGVVEYLEPEYVRAVRVGAPPPPASRASDQYGVAALVFNLITGSSYLAFSLQEAEAHRQIAEDPPLTFARGGAAPWPDVEAVLRTALCKDPAARHASMSRFSEQLARARAPRTGSAVRRSAQVLDGIRRRVRSRIGPDGPLLRDGLRHPPLASVSFGAAGIAWAAYRLACIEGRPELLALAQVWLQRSRELLTHPHAFFCAAVGLTAEQAGRTSLYHSPCGLHCVEAAVAGALGDLARRERAVRAFVSASQPLGENMELLSGAAGTLLGCAMLGESAWADDPAPASSTRALGHRVARALNAWMRRQDSVASCRELPNLGMAHGWAGLLYASLRWCESTGEPLPSEVPVRLDQLAECAEPSGRGLRWRWLDSAGEPAQGAAMPGWCNGAAGFVHLWTAAHRLCGEERFLRLAELAAWEAWEHVSEVPSLCCGLAGRSYALLRLFRLTGEAVWLDRAWQLAERAARMTPRGVDAQFPDSLYKGEVGIALLAADLASPADGATPFFEPEGWPRVAEDRP
jgi:serine/threonine-protein kinase